ncbi:hypothetical protein CKCBHOJB_03349 [Thauera sp. GDN1]|uniref:hypothetical protein n=1 Tax=Thauera sp. GDN1 TaxID=2944810 RepID=UPI002478656C|nr:hypothetical protein [Thauera sp. GDN1]WEN43721.1 hypothetical protein CKCBHOJB_03349 [Thauera sp. GDN1]
MKMHSGTRMFALLACAATLITGTDSAFAQQGEAAPALRLECGGIGLEESQRMRAEVGMHALTLFFSTMEGGFVTDVATRVDDPLGDRRVEASCGPLGQLDVTEAGRYRITATYAGQTQEHWIDLSPGGGARLALRWQE